MRLRHIEVFNAVMQTGSVSAAARLINVTQPAVSRTLQHAELQMGFALFQRARGRLTPTNEALALFPHIEKLFEQLDEVQRTLRAGKDAVAAFRGLAEQSLEQARASFARSQDASLSLARGFEASGQVVQSGLKEIQARVADALEAQAHETFGFFRAFTQVRSVSDMIDLQSSQLRKHFERGFDEVRELSSLATAVATKASEPVRKAFNHALEVQRPGR